MPLSFSFIFSSPIRSFNTNSRPRSLLFHLRSHTFICSLIFKVGGSALSAFNSIVQDFFGGRCNSNTTFPYSPTPHSPTDSHVVTCDRKDSNVWSMISQLKPRHHHLILRRCACTTLALRLRPAPPACISNPYSFARPAAHPAPRMAPH